MTDLQDGDVVLTSGDWSPGWSGILTSGDWSPGWSGILTSGDCLLSMAPRMECRAPILYRTQACSNLMSASTTRWPVWTSSLQPTTTKLSIFNYNSIIIDNNSAELKKKPKFLKPVHYFLINHFLCTIQKYSTYGDLYCSIPSHSGDRTHDLDRARWTC